MIRIVGVPYFLLIRLSDVGYVIWYGNLELRFETRFDLRQMNPPSNVALTVNSSDRFQGRSRYRRLVYAKRGRVGFLNSPNRMNVATTRAREWRLVVNYDYFSGQARNEKGPCKDPMLNAFAKAHEKVTLKELKQ